MPKVDVGQDLRAVFSLARRVSAGAAADSREEGPAVAIVTPGRLIVRVPCPPASAVSPQMLEGIRRIVPKSPKQRISVIANNSIVANSASPIQEAHRLIPFLGYLMGMAFDGHTVVVFEGHQSALSAGCEGATLLLVDQAMIPHLQADWATVAGSAIEDSRILSLGRDGSMAWIVPDVRPVTVRPSTSDQSEELRYARPSLRRGIHWPTWGALLTLVPVPMTTCLCGHMNWLSLPFTVGAVSLAWWGVQRSGLRPPGRVFVILVMIIVLIALAKNFIDLLWLGHDPLLRGVV